MTLKSRKARVSDLEAKHWPKGGQVPLVRLGLTVGVKPNESIEDACARKGLDYASLTRSQEPRPGTARVEVTLHPSPKEVEK